MTMTTHVAGPALIKVDTASEHALEQLGYTINGAEITEQRFLLDVPGDENGGDAGPPIDIQDMGEIHIIRLLMTKWDDAVMAKVRPGQYGGTAGVVPAAGTLLIAAEKTFRLVIHSAAEARNYPIVVFREPKEINKGSKYSQQLLVATAYKHLSTGLLYNTTTS